MKNAKELMLEFTAFSIRNPKKAAEMFAEDGAFEMPYLATFGIPSQYKGRDAIAGFFQFVRDLYPGFQFENIKVLMILPTRPLGNTSSPRCPAKRDDPFISSSLGAWSPRMERSSC